MNVKTPIVRWLDEASALSTERLVEEIQDDSLDQDWRAICRKTLARRHRMEQEREGDCHYGLNSESMRAER